MQYMCGLYKSSTAEAGAPAAGKPACVKFRSSQLRGAPLSCGDRTVW